MVNLDYLVPMLYEFSISLIGAFVAFQVGKKYSRLKTKIIKNFFFVILSLSLAVFSAAISRVLRYFEIWEISPGKFIELLAVTVSFIALSNIFFLQFGLNVFHPKIQKKTRLVIISIFSVFTGAYMIYTMVFGLFIVDLSTLIWSFLLILSLIVDTYIIYSCFQLNRKLDEKVDKFFVGILGLAPISLIMIYIFFLIDRVLGANFTIFYYFGWFMVVLVSLFLYIGVIRPSKIENWLKRNKPMEQKS
ncbi:hypothetical protein NEF87_003849 [Candidatus Lokiarchaeum ossiferum]|uniref:Uncharacterized protein n=1 Tax=Candidatus Lokiarchaeum ossiferum TaxID=2951803 RepID=A0ABY6HYP8_9ARCH|nr:hypothetical protein NEF87_003849 [Candidatus Lokiarchaeum sp. B-35]